MAGISSRRRARALARRKFRAPNCECICALGWTRMAPCGRRGQTFIPWPRPPDFHRAQGTYVDLDRPAKGNQTGRRREGRERCPRNRLKLKQFLVFPYPEETGLAPSCPAGVARNRKDEKTAQRRRRGVYWLVAGKAKWKSWLNAYGETQSPSASCPVPGVNKL